MSYRLIYSSQAAPDLVEGELQDMLKESRLRNQVRGITGVLVFVDGVFLQILEGEKDDVLELMERIGRDRRHSGLRVIHEEEGAEPVFASWNMAYLHPGIEQMAKWAELDGATTMPEVLAAVEANPGRLPGIVVNVLKAIASP